MASCTEGLEKAGGGQGRTAGCPGDAGWVQRRRDKPES